METGVAFQNWLHIGILFNRARLLIWQGGQRTSEIPNPKLTFPSQIHSCWGLFQPVHPAPYYSSLLSHTPLRNIEPCHNSTDCLAVFPREELANFQRTWPDSLLLPQQRLIPHSEGSLQNGAALKVFPQAAPNLP